MQVMSFESGWDIESVSQPCLGFRIEGGTEDLLNCIDRSAEHAHAIKRVGIGYYSVSEISLALGRLIGRAYLLIIP
jgi:hypothetical protein